MKFNVDDNIRYCYVYVNNIKYKILAYGYTKNETTGMIDFYYGQNTTASIPINACQLITRYENTISLCED